MTDSSSVPSSALIAEIKQLLEGITPGPWAWEWIAEKSNEWAVGQAWREDGTPIDGQISDGEWLEDTIIDRRLVGMNESGHANAADAKFIAASPRLVAALLVSVEQMARDREDLDQCRQILAADMTLQSVTAPLPSPAQPLHGVALSVYGAIQELRQCRAAESSLAALRQGLERIAVEMNSYAGEAGDSRLQRILGWSKQISTLLEP